MSEPLSHSRRHRRAEVRRLPARLRVIRIAELLFFPVIGYMLLSLPVPSAARPGEWVATLVLAAEAVAAVAVAVGLAKRRRWAWVLAMLLAAWVIVSSVLRGAAVLRAALALGRLMTAGVVGLFAWTVITQLVVLACCLTFRDWREELR